MNNWGHVDQAFLQMVMLLINTVKQNCLFLVPAFLLAGLITAIVRSVFTQSQMSVNGGFMLRGILIWCVLFNYIEIIDLVTGGIEGFRDLIPQPGTILDDLNEFSNMAINTSKTVSDPNVPTQDKILEFAKGLFDFNFGLLYFVNAALEEGLTMLVRIGLEKIRAACLSDRGRALVTGPVGLSGDGESERPLVSRLVFGPHVVSHDTHSGCDHSQLQPGRFRPHVRFAHDSNGFAGGQHCLHAHVFDGADLDFLLCRTGLDQRVFIQIGRHCGNRGRNNRGGGKTLCRRGGKNRIIDGSKRLG